MYGLLATAAILASSALAHSVGSAIVINKCSYDVFLANVPAQDGGFEQADETLSSNAKWTQQWTQLSNDQGWSIKLSKDSSLANILQYEYTFHNDGTIWYDLSEVNGNPWDGNWEITAESEGNACSPKQQAYRYATDDAYGMQSCPQDATITVTLCSGDESNDGGAASASASLASETSIEATATSVSSYSTPTSDAPIAISVTASSAPTSDAPTSVSIAPSSETSFYRGSWSHYHHKASSATPSSSPSPTTFATLTTSTDSEYGATVVQTDVVTEVVTATAYGRFAKRHNHHARHEHA